MKNNAIAAPEWFRKNSVYQINPRTFSSEGTLRAIINELPFLKELGFNIIYLCPIFDMDASTKIENWSPRQIKSNTQNPKNMYRMNDYFSIDEEYGTMEELKELVEAAHSMEMKVLLDLVYAHIGPDAPIIKKHPEFIIQNPDGSFKYTQWNFPAIDFRCEGLREYLYCNMVYYISVIDADGFRLDVGDGIPIDFWREARRRIQSIKPDAVMINEGNNYANMTIAFDSCYNFPWHEKIRSVFCADQPASILRECHERLFSILPDGGCMLNDIDNHDTVTDWEGRTEVVATNDGMEQIEVINFLIDGTPMVYCGNELACEAKLSMFANRFFMGEFEVTDRSDKNSEKSKRRQLIIKTLHKMKAENPVLCDGKTTWIDTSEPEKILFFKRELDGKELYFIGNTKNTTTSLELNATLEGHTCVLCNGEHKLGDGKITLKPFEYAVFE